MNRDEAIRRLEGEKPPWDVIVVGGGATGLAVAVDASSRGFSTLLLEQSDFAKATSSRSTKLIHGGFRYLKQGNVHLVSESLHERGLLLRNAPHVVHPLAFVVPAYRWWEKAYYGAGLKIYDAMAGALSIGRSQMISKEETLQLVPTIQPDGLRGGVRYFDGQFDDARLAICMARTVFDQGGLAINYMRVNKLLKKDDRVCGVVAVDEESGKEYELQARVVVNATGIFTDELRLKDRPDTGRMMTVSQGTHIVVDRKFLPGGTAIMVPKTEDGRILFAIPWQGRVVIGTTDLPVNAPCAEPRPTEGEIEFLLSHASHYLAKSPGEGDIRSVFAGLRPLAKGGGGNTSAISRDHVIEVSRSGLVTITGGKWTTCRKMAEDTVNRAIQVGGLAGRPCVTSTLPLHGADVGDNATEDDSAAVFGAYGTDARHLSALVIKRPELAQRLHARFPNVAAEVIWAVRNEMARTVEDVLARRLRVLMLDAGAALESAPHVARLMAGELGKNADWQQRQVESFEKVAAQYLVASRSAL